MRNYIQVIDDLSECLNFKSTDEKKAKLNKRVFNMCLTELKEDFKTDVSTKYLMGFVIGDEKQKSNRVNYLLKQIGLNERKSVLMNNTTYNIFTKEKKTTDVITKVDLVNSIKIFKRTFDKNGVEKITSRLIPITTHDNNGVQHNSKVGIIVYQNKVYRHYNQILL